MLGPMSTNFVYADANFIAFCHFHIFDLINYCDYVINFDTICCLRIRPNISSTYKTFIFYS